MNNSKIEYHNIEAGYTMKVRVYPNKAAREYIDGVLTGLEKAANITLWELKQHNLEICDVDKNDSNVLWPNFDKMAQASWLDKLRKQNAAVSKERVPGATLSSKVGGLFLADMKKAWEKQGKLPVDAWFDKKTKKGKPALHFYGAKKRKISFYVQIPVNKFTIDEEGRIYVTPSKKLGTMRVRGWNDKITFGKNGLTFFEYYNGNTKDTISCRISKLSIGENDAEYYLTMTLKNINRPFKVAEKREPNGIDLNVKEDTGVATSRLDENGKQIVYNNKKFKEQVQARSDELHRRLFRRQGISNADFRENYIKVKKENKKLSFDDKKPLPQSSNRYKKTQKELRRLELKVQRKRDIYQHEISAKEIEMSSSIGLESLNVKGMLKNNNLSYSISDAAFSSQLNKFKYKSEWANIPVIEVGQWFPSSHVCPGCGYRMEGEEKFGLETRNWVCPDCGKSWLRDHAAAINIRDESIRMQNNPKESKPIELKAPKKIAKKKDRPLDKNHPEIIIHYDENMKAMYKNPYIVIHADGRVLDDAQGYGYDTAQKAMKAYNHKYMCVKA